MTNEQTTNEPNSQASEKSSGVENSAEALEATKNLDASETSNDDGKDAQSKEDGQKEKESGFEKRIRKLTKQKGDVQRELEYWKSLHLKNAQEPSREETKAKTQVSDGKPKAEDFESHAEFVEALADWKYEQRKAQDEKTQKESQLKTEFQKRVETFQSKVKEYQKAHPEFEELVNDLDTPVSVGVQETILSSEVGVELMHELAKDTENFERINALSPIAAARELGRIEARIHAQKESSNSEPKKQSSAPTPLKPVGKHGSGGVKKSITDPDLSFADYVKLRRSK